MEGVGIVGHHGGRARLHEVGVHEVLLRVPQELFVRGLVGEGGDQLGGELGGHDSVQDGGDVLDWSPLDGGKGLGDGGRSFLDLRSRSNQGAENTSGWADFSGTLPEGFSGVVSSRSFLEEVGVSLFDS